MKPLKTIYWTRACLGLAIGLLCGLYVYSSVSTELGGLYTLLTGLSFAMLFYIATYYILKFKFFLKVEKPSKLVSQGIGIYFFAWIVSWTLLVTLIMPSVLIEIQDIETGSKVVNQQFWIVARNSNDQIVRNASTTSGVVRMALLPPGAYTFELGGTNQSQAKTITWLQSPQLHFNVTLLPG